MSDTSAAVEKLRLEEKDGEADDDGDVKENASDEETQDDDDEIEEQTKAGTKRMKKKLTTTTTRPLNPMWIIGTDPRMTRSGPHQQVTIMVEVVAQCCEKRATPQNTKWPLMLIFECMAEDFVHNFIGGFLEAGRVDVLLKTMETFPR
eukprot:TRINITY_DN15176_c0_g1_i1.p1 TRINITY_DN15176_c0_g1~~TRINITY_DN15176_c0_g1_i1.p1  ORF type:complete len:148 (+),score=18.74 TRINITY_DN15176_c0_g1_i1:213-656(+)